mmetsp:Transcript_852/g.1757  ORF Transcript_852/g.1757 Transcript_852/m.1757 type:complete len:146 (+) Transcript_852:105-542(+)
MVSQQSPLDNAKMLQALKHSITLLAPCGGDSAKIKTALYKNCAFLPTKSSGTCIAFANEAEFVPSSRSSSCSSSISKSRLSSSSSYSFFSCSSPVSTSVPQEIRPARPHTEATSRAAVKDIGSRLLMLLDDFVRKYESVKAADKL